VIGGGVQEAGPGPVVTCKLQGGTDEWALIRSRGRSVLEARALLQGPAVDASYFEIPVGAGGGEREQKVVQLFNVLRDGERLAGQRRALMTVLGALALLTVVALAGDLGRGALTLVAALTGATLIGVGRLRQLERRNQRVIQELVAAVGARGF
jgi:hypothetical protein